MKPGPDEKNLLLYGKIYDSGDGIPAEQMKNAFKPIHKEADGKYRNDEGRGICLSMCKYICDNMNGSVKIDSSMKKGSKVIFQMKIEPPREVDLGNRSEKRE